MAKMERKDVISWINGIKQNMTQTDVDATKKGLLEAFGEKSRPESERANFPGKRKPGESIQDYRARTGDLQAYPDEPGYVDDPDHPQPDESPEAFQARMSAKEGRPFAAGDTRRTQPPARGTETNPAARRPATNPPTPRNDGL